MSIIDNIKSALLPDAEAKLKARIAELDAQIAASRDLVNKPDGIGDVISERSRLDARLSNLMHERASAERDAADRERLGRASERLAEAKHAAAQASVSMQAARAARAQAEQAHTAMQARIASAQAAVEADASALAEWQLKAAQALTDGKTEPKRPTASSGGADLHALRGASDLLAARVEAAADAERIAADAMRDARRATAMEMLNVVEGEVAVARAAWAPVLARWHAIHAINGMSVLERAEVPDDADLRRAQAALEADLI